jgi:hypothetical protein
METDLDEFSFANALLSLRYSKDDLDEDRSLASEVKVGNDFNLISESVNSDNTFLADIYN